MRCTVGVPTYHRPDRVAALLESLLDQTTLPEETVVVDDSTDDRTAAVVHEFEGRFEDHGIELVYRHRSDEQSMPGARNEIVETASGDIVCFLDDDVVCEPTWLERLRETYGEHPDAVAVGGPAIAVDDDGEPVAEPVHADRNMNVINRYGETREIADRWVPAEPVQTDTLSGANMSFRRRALTDVGGFDPGYRGSAHWEETDVFARLGRRERRSTVLYAPGVRVDHFESPAGGARDEGSERRQLYWYARNHVRFKRRNFPDTFWIGLLRLLVYTEHTPPPLWKHLGAAVVHRSLSPLWFLRGCLDGVYYETDPL